MVEGRNTRMKNILIFGAGERGRELIDQYIDYNGKNIIVAIVDNHPRCSQYRNIPVVQPEEIHRFTYDEIWVCTIYYSQVKKQLMEEYGILEERIIYTEPVMPILDERIREKYESELRVGYERKDDLAEVLNYIKKYPARMYCYPFVDEYMHKEVPVHYDVNKNMYYVVHKSKKMFFSRKMDAEQKVRFYYNSIVMEQDERSPHCYWNCEYIREFMSGVVVDVGAAEGIFALEVIDEAEHIYLFEVEEDWIEALKYTFEPYSEKVTIIRKFVADFDDEDHCRLDTIFRNIKVDCIKMDIEGAELSALKGAENILTEQELKLAICTYHHPCDNEHITAYLKGMGYGTENSKGYILCQGAWELDNKEVTFRRGLLFAEREGDLK